MINNKKRLLLKSMALFSSVALISSCTEKSEVKPNFLDNKFPDIKLRMVTSFPRNLPGADIPAQMLAKRIKYMSQGKIDITHYAASKY